ncbi:hypothetical protein CAP35_10750 [Chitinophagaceae bacterium IBVUCB1]|nr:hypothetical protein CAP35_10750 [Chitinophagaceae bacterium IBVUCB1]
MKNVLFLTIVSLVVFASCEKRINVNGDHKNRHQMILGKKWAIVSKQVNGSPANMKDCEKDNYYVFEDNGNGRWEEGANNCFATGGSGNGGGNGGGGNDTTIATKEGEPIPTYTGFTWSMTGDGFAIYMKNFGVSGYNPEWSIESMDYTTLDVRSVEKVNGVIYVYNIRLKAL